MISDNVSIRTCLTFYSNTAQCTFLISFFPTMKLEGINLIFLSLLTLRVFEAAKRQGVVKRGTLALSKTRRERLAELAISYNGSYISTNCPSDFPHPLEVFNNLVTN